MKELLAREVQQGVCVCGGVCRRTDGRTDDRQVKELLKREVQQSESELQRNAAIIADYKQVSPAAPSPVHLKPDAGCGRRGMDSSAAWWAVRADLTWCVLCGVGRSVLTWCVYVVSTGLL